MTRVTTFLVQTFDNSKGARLKPDALLLAGRRRRSSYSRETFLEPHGCGRVFRQSDPETGDYDDQPTIFYRAGQLPAEFDGMP
jgi:hypothetical protein